MISLIVAISKNNIIGSNGKLPWPRIAEDMKWFRERTTDNVVIMGRNTWESLNSIPLKNRINVVVTSKLIDGVDVISDLLDQNISAYELAYPNKEIFIIGGAQLYESTKHLVDRIYLTRVHQRFDGDAFLNIDEFLAGTVLVDSIRVSTERDIDVSFETYDRVK